MLLFGPTVPLNSVRSKIQRKTPAMDRIAEMNCTKFLHLSAAEHFASRKRKPKQKQINGSIANTVAAYFSVTTVYFGGKKMVRTVPILID